MFSFAKEKKQTNPYSLDFDNRTENHSNTVLLYERLTVINWRAIGWGNSRRRSTAGRHTLKRATQIKRIRSESLHTESLRLWVKKSLVRALLEYGGTMRDPCLGWFHEERAARFVKRNCTRHEGCVTN